MKKLIINADDFGNSEENNEAVLRGYNAGIITSASLMSNTKEFDNAIKIIKDLKKLDIGIHLNIIEGKSLTNQDMLCDKDGNFNNSYMDLILKSYNKTFIKQTETEFRAQIEKALSHTQLSHIDSHVHTHAIPNIFKLTLKLAQEYGIKYIRTQKEIPYILLNKSLDLKYPVNVVKNILLNTFTLINNIQIKKTNIQTNDYFVGVLYTGRMSEQSILQGLKKITKDNTITEVLFHPYYSDNIKENKYYNYEEFLITQIPNLKDKLINSGFTLSTR